MFIWDGFEGASHLPPPQLLQGFGWGKKFKTLLYIPVQSIFINTHLSSP